MSRENVEIVARGYAHFAATGEFIVEGVSPDFVWDMSKFEGWPERQAYAGVEGAREFLAEWTSAWEEWRLDVKRFVDAGAKVIAVAHQEGRSKVSGLLVEMDFAQVWSFAEGLQTRMEMFSDVSQAFEHVGLQE